MKNALITFLVLVAVVCLYIAVSTLRVPLPGQKGILSKVIRADLTLPISAVGEVQPIRRAMIKSEASGEVIEILKKPGERIEAGELIMRLQRDDEQRNVDRAALGMTITEARLGDAQTAVIQAEGADLRSAGASVAQIEASLLLTEFRARRAEETPETFTEEERLQRLSAYKRELAQLESAKAALEQRELAVLRAKQAVKVAEADFETAKTTLADAQKQLTKTDIVSPITGLVGSINTQIGEVIQGGKSTFTGGTVLAEILDMSRLMLRAEVDEADIGRVTELAPVWAKPGHATHEQMPTDMNDPLLQAHQSTIRVETYPGEEFTGIIERIHPNPRTLSGVTTFWVDVIITSPNREKLLPGMRAEVAFTSEHVENALLCPNEAIHERSTGEYGVYVPKDNPEPDEEPIVFVRCEIGLSDGTLTEIRSGLTEGQKIYKRLPRKVATATKFKKKERD